MTQDGFPLNDLPSELLMQIISNVDTYRNERILGQNPDDPPPSPPDYYLMGDFLTGCQPLCSLCLTSKRFRNLAQEHLFYAPVLGGAVFRFPAEGSELTSERSRSRIAYFLRTIVERPDLRRHVKQIRFCFSLDGERRRTKEESNHGAEVLSSVSDLLTQAYGIIDTFDIPGPLKTAWKVRMYGAHGRYAMLAIVLGLLPQLERLSFSEESLDHWLGDGIEHILGAYAEFPQKLESYSIRCLPIGQNLKYLKVSSRTSVNLDGIHMIPSLDTLDISMSIASLRSQGVQALSELYTAFRSSMTFRNIRHLRLDFQIKSMGIWNFAARTGITHILQAFSELKSLDFYAEPSSEKNPFRSVRAFPHYQANIQTYPDAPSPADFDSNADGAYWDERVYAARTDYTDYQYLVDSLVSIRPHLETLRLPGGFWTLPGASRKLIPRFQLFPKLQRLALPQAAILSIRLYNMRFPETVQGDFELLPTEVLPPRLRCLEIFDADADLLKSAWLQELFKEQGDHCRWPDLNRLEIFFRPMFDDKEFADLVAKKSWDSFWTLADDAAFQVLVGRDDDTPML
jgi:hypothetical protein